MGLSLPRPAPPRPRSCAADPRADRVGHPARHGTQRLLRHRDAVPDPLDARRGTRLPRTGPPAARTLAWAPAVTAAVQAAADGRRARALLPNRALFPGRGLPGGSH